MNYTGGTFMSKKITADTITFPATHPLTGEPVLIALAPRRLCETRKGDLAFALGRLRFQQGSPMLVEHLGGLFLEHTLCGRVLTCGYGDEFDITHIFSDDGY